jgi:hypothetical protein
MKPSRAIWILGIALVGLIILLTPVPAFAQSCALCYTQAASSGSRMIQALKSADYEWKNDDSPEDPSRFSPDDPQD